MIQFDFPSRGPKMISIDSGNDISPELRRFRELIAKNREERLRLSKNIAKVSRQVAKTRAHARDAIRTSAASKRATQRQFAALKRVYSDLCAAFKGIESRNASAQKTLLRLVLRCQSCMEQDLTSEQHITQLEGIRFEYLLVLRMQGADEAQAAKYAAVEDLIEMIVVAVEPYKGN